MGVSAFVRFVNLMRASPVLAAMNMMTEASPSTVQRRLKSLRAKGLLGFEAAAHDACIRHVVATPEGQAYFARMSELMQQAMGRG